MKTRTALGRTLFASLVLLILVAAVSASIGAVPVYWRDVLAGDDTARAVLFAVRLPRIALAAMVGAILAIAGLTFQTLLRNSLADPFTLGVSGGAACGAAIATAAGWARFHGVVPLFAFAGAGFATVAVFSLARRRDRVDTTRLLLAGLVLNALFSALILIALSLTAGSDLPSALRWMMGSFANPRWRDVILLGSALVVSLALLIWHAGDLRMLAYGEEDARAHGVDTERLKIVAFIGGSLATGAAVSVSGIIGFVGLLVPHAIRLMTRHDYRGSLPLCAVGGATLLVAADTIARVVIAPAELPVGAITALLGVPFFLVLMRRVSR